jgi:hypothetical protein
VTSNAAPKFGSASMISLGEKSLPKLDLTS